MFIEKFGEKGEKYQLDMCTNNCADMVNWALDLLFPEDARCLNVFYKAFQALCCLACIGCCAASCCPVPPCFNSPGDELRRAKLLSLKHGKPPEEKESKLEDPLLSHEIFLSI